MLLASVTGDRPYLLHRVDLWYSEYWVLPGHRGDVSSAADWGVWADVPGDEASGDCVSAEGGGGGGGGGGGDGGGDGGLPAAYGLGERWR